MKNTSAFTLAEVLITLLIIGVISSIVIPGLINNTQDAEYKTAWKKAYADISQATMRLTTDNGGTLKGASSNHDSFRNLYLPYLNSALSCNSGTSRGSCWHNDNTWKYLNGTNASKSDTASVMINNGNLLRFFYIDSNCNDTSYGIPECGHITVDINGFKKPNINGKDIFWLHITATGTKPWGAQGDSAGYLPAVDCISTGEGYGCSALYLYQ